MNESSHQLRLDRRTVLKSLPAGFMAAGILGIGDTPATLAGQAPRVLPEGKLPGDGRLGELKDLNGYFPFTPSKTPEQWKQRAAEVRRQILLACGLWPMPIKRPIKATVHGRVERDEYTVERVYFESSPGLYVTGSLYRPRGKQGPLPAILCPHGHWANGRFYAHNDAQLQAELKSGAEKYPVGGRHPLQARCVQLARMGCLVFHYDMLGVADSATPLSHELVHRFAQQRPEMNSPEDWGLYSAQAELRLVNVFGLQIWNNIRALDWLLSLKEVDPERVGITGASGGGTQTMIMAAIDDRLAAAFPAVMVSTAMQGGCTCENACYLRVDTGNIEFAALAAPKPMGLTAANDWTKELETKGLPELRQHYQMLGAADRVEGKYFNFGHNYNYVSRAMMYEFFNRHLNLGIQGPIVEQDYKPLTIEELTVWTEGRHKPEGGDEAERKVVRAFYADAVAPIKKLHPRDAKSWQEYRRVVGNAFQTMVGHGLPSAGDVTDEPVREVPGDGYRAVALLLRNRTHGEELPAVFLLPTNWNQQAVIWLTDEGKAGLFDDAGKPIDAVQKLLAGGVAVAGVDLLYQGEFLPDGNALTESRKVSNPREFLGYTLGYNHPLVSQRVQDVLTVVAYCRNHVPKPTAIHLAALGKVGAVAAAAAGIAGKAVDKLAIGTGGFRFASITEIRDPDLWPGAVKYGDVPGLLSLCAPHPLWLAGEKEVPQLVADCYRAVGKEGGVTLYGGPEQDAATAAAQWLLG